MGSFQLVRRRPDGDEMMRIGMSTVTKQEGLVSSSYFVRN